MRKSQRLIWALAGSIFLVGCASLAPTIQQDPLRVRVIAFNDFHGHLQTPAPVRVPDPSDPASYISVHAGGAAHLASAIHTAREGQRHSVVVAAGDLVGASPLISSMFFDEPAIEALDALGLDIASVGNHEFDRGRDELLRLIRGGCRPEGCVTGQPYRGARFAYLAANVRDTTTGESFLPPYVVREFDGVPVAFIGLALKETPSIVGKAGIAGLRFEDEADTVNRLVPELKARGVGVIVVLIHQGATTSGAYNDPSCPGMQGEIIDIVKHFDKAVDVVVSAHTHQAYLCRVDGRPVTSAGSYGRFLTEIDIEIDRTTREVVQYKMRNVLVDTEKVPGNEKVAAVVKKFADLSGPRTNRVVGYIQGELVPLPNWAGESGLGDVIADAQLAATHTAGAQIAFMNPGGIRAPLLTAREDRGVTFSDIFTVQPFGNTLVTMTLTGEQIHQLLEQQFSGDTTRRARIMQVSKGFAYAWDAAKPAGRRIVEGSTTLDGEPVVPEKSYRVTVNNFMADGGDGFTVLREGRDREGGVLDVDALEAYLRANSPVAAGPPGRIGRLE